MPPKPIRLGILVPSSNTSLEPLTTRIISCLPSNSLKSSSNKSSNSSNSPPNSPQVTVHFSRIPVTSISLSSTSTSQFDTATLLASAQLLADAKVNIIGWSGTSAGWLGFASDEQLCAAIEDATGIPATTSVIGLNAALEKLGVRRLGLLTPYTTDVQQRIVGNYGDVGVEVVRERHLSVKSNSEIAEIGQEVLGEGVRAVAGVEDEGDGEGRGRVQAVTTFCTNLMAADKVVEWEREVGVPVLDTVATVVWDSLRKCGVDTKPLAKDWGSLFEL